MITTIGQIYKRIPAITLQGLSRDKIASLCVQQYIQSQWLKTLCLTLMNRDISIYRVVSTRPDGVSLTLHLPNANREEHK